MRFPLIPVLVSAERCNFLFALGFTAMGVHSLINGSYLLSLGASLSAVIMFVYSWSLSLAIERLAKCDTP